MSILGSKSSALKIACKLLRKLGFEAETRPGWKGNVYCKINKPNKANAIKEICKIKNPVIVDVGAAIDYGDNWVQMFLDIYEDPYIYAIEPRPEAVTHLEDEYESNNSVSIIPRAVGERRKSIELKVPEVSGSASAYVPKDLDWRSDSHKEPIKKVKVEQNTIDKLISKKVDILKLDTEGHELKVLEGAQNTIQNVKIVISELQFNPYYEGAVSAETMIEYLKSEEFIFHGLYDIVTVENNKLIHADGLFIKEQR